MLNQDGTPRQNSQHEKLKNTIQRQEAEVERLKEEKSALPRKSGCVDIGGLQIVQTNRCGRKISIRFRDDFCLECAKTDGGLVTAVFQSRK